MPNLSIPASDAATLQGHGLVVADGALGRAMVRLLLDQAPALTLSLTGRTPDPRPDPGGSSSRSLIASSTASWISADWCSMPAAGSMAPPPIRPLKSAWLLCGVLESKAEQ